MLDFLKRNFPIILIGCVILILFMVVIGLGEKEENQGPLPSLIRVVSEQIDFITGNTKDDTIPVDNSVVPTPPEELQYSFDGQEINGLIVKDGMLITKEEYNELMYAEKAKAVEEAFVIKDSAEIDARYGTYEIVYTADGFLPKKGYVFINQNTKWTNGTDQPITLMQTHPKYKETVWADGLTLQPGQSYEFRATKSGFWAVREVTSKKAISLTASRAERYMESNPSTN